MDADTCPICGAELRPGEIHVTATSSCVEVLRKNVAALMDQCYQMEATILSTVKDNEELEAQIDALKAERDAARAALAALWKAFPDDVPVDSETAYAARQAAKE